NPIFPTFQITSATKFTVAGHASHSSGAFTVRARGVAGDVLAASDQVKAPDTNNWGESQAPTALKHATRSVKVAKVPITVRNPGDQNNPYHSLPFPGRSDIFLSDLAGFGASRGKSTRGRTATAQPSDPAGSTRRPTQLRRSRGRSRRVAEQS